MANDA